MRDIHPVTWMYIIFIVPLGIAIIVYIAMQLYLAVRNRKKQHVISIETPGGDGFSLYCDFSGNTVLAWYVYRTSRGSAETADMLEAHNISSALFWSLSMVEPEAGWEGKLELLKDRYLVFSRGGLYHSLYDIKDNRTLVHIAEPHEDYASWAEERGMESPYPTDESYRKWAEETLHKPIADNLKGETP
jgi:hypothetical protein